MWWQLYTEGRRYVAGAKLYISCVEPVILTTVVTIIVSAAQYVRSTIVISTILFALPVYFKFKVMDGLMLQRVMTAAYLIAEASRYELRTRPWNVGREKYPISHYDLFRNSRSVLIICKLAGVSWHRRRGFLLPTTQLKVPRDGLTTFHSWLPITAYSCVY